MHGNKTKVAVITLGCRVNQAESSMIEGTLKESGAQIVNFGGKPDFCVINTCTVTAKSDADSRNMIRRAVKTGAKVIVTGCFAQLRREEMKALPGIYDIIGNENKERIASVIMERELEPVFSVQFRSRPHLKVQDGCNFNCSYCSVPYARGNSRSLAMDEAVKRALSLESRGFQEIVLTGIHLGSYGKDLRDNMNLAGLVKEILKRTGIRRIRLSSIEINEVDDELIEILKDERICKHLHVPLQSGCDNILKNMRRSYSSIEYKKKLMTITSALGDIAIGTDIIVGFPGEEEEDFDATYRFVQELPFTYLHIFPFSYREGTDAFRIGNPVPQSIVAKRVSALKQLDGKIRFQYMSDFVGKILDVIVEETTEEGYTVGTSGNYLKVLVHTGELISGSMVFVRSEGIQDKHLRGFLIT